MIRLHIIADSDDDNDQAVKLKVRDAILKNVGDRLSKTDKNECRDEIINDLNEFEDIALSLIHISIYRTKNDRSDENDSIG